MTSNARLVSLVETLKRVLDESGIPTHDAMGVELTIEARVHILARRARAADSALAHMHKVIEESRV